VQNEQQRSERQIIKDGTHEPKHQHEPPNKADIPAFRLIDQLTIDAVGRDGHLGDIGQQARQENLFRQRGRNGRNREAPAMLNILPKFALVAINTYLSVLAKVVRP